MAEIRAIPWNGFTLASLFSGCGGSCLGFRMAGFRVVYANEFIPAARDSYRANNPDTPIDDCDVRRVTAKSLIAAAETGLESIGATGIDVLEGSPPCASFSMAGKREANWGKVKEYSETRQRVDDLFFEYARILAELRPKVFVAENVSGLVRGTAKGYFLDIFERLSACGYRVRCRALDAQWLGVPQARKRVIFIGVREDLERVPVFPKPLPYRYSVRDALPWIQRVAHAGNDKIRHLQWTSGECPSPTILQSDAQRGDTAYLSAGGWGEFIVTKHGPRSVDEPAPTIQTHNSPKTESEMTLSQIVALRGGTKKPFDGKGKQYSLDNPCPTVLEGSTLFEVERAQPTEKRRFSIAELKRICAFPDDFILTGTYAQQWERLGRAVPPLMMRAIAEVIRDQILCPQPIR